MTTWSLFKSSETLREPFHVSVVAIFTGITWPLRSSAAVDERDLFLSLRERGNGVVRVCGGVTVFDVSICYETRNFGPVCPSVLFLCSGGSRKGVLEGLLTQLIVRYGPLDSIRAQQCSRPMLPMLQLLPLLEYCQSKSLGAGRRVRDLKPFQCPVYKSHPTFQIWPCYQGIH